MKNSLKSRPKHGGARLGAGRKPKPNPRLGLPKAASARAVLEALMRSDDIAPNLRLRAAAEVAKLEREQHEDAMRRSEWGDVEPYL